MALGLVPLAACTHAPAKPALGTAQPAQATAQPALATAQPALGAPKALVEKPLHPAHDTPQPSRETSKPALTTPKPPRDLPQAAASATLPAYGNVRPGIVPAAAPPPHAGSAQGSAAPTGAPHGPAIYSATISPSVVHNGEAMTWAVRTTHDVVSVTAHVSAYTLPLRREKSGLFTLSFTVPSNVPGIFHGSYSLDIVAQNGSGTTATRTLPLIFQ